jgi:transcriptional regulator with XRE-family HTH domain
METVPQRQARIADVAARAGVGIATVSRVLNGRANVSEETREKVLDAIRTLDYPVRSRATAAEATLVIGVLTLVHELVADRGVRGSSPPGDRPRLHAGHRVAGRERRRSACSRTVTEPTGC